MFIRVPELPARKCPIHKGFRGGARECPIHAGFGAPEKPRALWEKVEKIKRAQVHLPKEVA